MLLVAALFLVFAYRSQLRELPGYEVTADFERVDGIHQGSDVRIGGVKVGVIQGLDLVPETYQARLTLAIEPRIKLPADSSAAIDCGVERYGMCCICRPAS